MSDVVSGDMPGLVVRVAGHPRPQPRPRFLGRRAVATVGPATRWRDRVKAAASEAGRAARGMSWLEGPVSVDMAFTLPTPKADRHGQPHAVKPDIDNLAKLVLDALADGGILRRGDQVVAGGTWRKVWGASSAAGVVAVVRPVSLVAREGDVNCTAPAGWLIAAQCEKEKPAAR